MTQHATTCHMCHCPIVLSIADDYSVSHDPNKIIPLAVCNRCADYRTSCRSIEDKLIAQCQDVAIAHQYTRRPDDRTIANIRSLTERYSRIVFAYYGLQPIIDESFPDGLISSPRQIGKVLSMFKRGVRDIAAAQSHERQPELVDS